MSELINTNDNRATLRWKLLTGASALVLTATMVSVAKAGDSDRSQVWIEFGGQLERLSGQPQAFTPSFFALANPQDLHVMTDAQRPSNWAFGGEGKISLMPQGSDWIFSAAIRYGRSNNSHRLHHQSPFVSVEKYFLPFIPPTTRPLHRAIFSDANARSAETHTVLDFLAGKDVGLGMFGTKGTSVVSAGVRFAQFVSNADTSLYARPVVEPNVTIVIPGKYKGAHAFYQTYTAMLHAEHTTHAVGPTVSWEASVPMAGNGDDSELTFDWGVNAAVLFGRRQANIHHQTISHDYHQVFGSYYTAHQSTQIVNRKQRHTVAIPNVGGFAGISLKFPNAKVNLGYRADFFFQAVDDGIDAPESGNRGYYGPYASISVGLGD